MRSTFKVLFYLKKNAPKKNGYVPVMCRITIDGTIAQFSCKLDVNPDLWDTQSGRASGRTAEAKDTNLFLDNIRIGVNTHYREIFDKDNYVTAEKVKNAYLGLGMKHETILKVFAQHNKDFEKQVGKMKSKSTYQKYCTVYRHVQEFIRYRYNVSDIALKELTPAFIIDFELYLRANQNCTNNTVWVYMMPLRRMITIAQNNGWLNRDPFVEYSISPEDADRGYLTKEEIKLMMNAPMTKKKHELVRDLFIFCCFTGLSFRDLKNLKTDNLQTSFDGHEWIITKRQKTKVQSNIRLLDVPRRIIEKYKGIAKDNKVFPVPTYGNLRDNITLIVQACGIKKHVTWHMSRHTYATEICLTNGMPIETLSKTLGHTNISTTQIYAKITNEKVSHDMEALSHKLQDIEEYVCETL